MSPPANCLHRRTPKSTLVSCLRCVSAFACTHICVCASSYMCVCALPICLKLKTAGGTKTSCAQRTKASIYSSYPTHPTKTRINNPSTPTCPDTSVPIHIHKRIYTDNTHTHTDKDTDTDIGTHAHTHPHNTPAQSHVHVPTVGAIHARTQTSCLDGLPRCNCYLLPTLEILRMCVRVCMCVCVCGMCVCVCVHRHRHGVRR